MECWVWNGMKSYKELKDKEQEKDQQQDGWIQVQSLKIQTKCSGETLHVGSPEAETDRMGPMVATVRTGDHGSRYVRCVPCSKTPPYYHSHTSVTSRHSNVFSLNAQN